MHCESDVSNGLTLWLWSISSRDLYPKTSWERNNADGTRGEEYTTKPSKVSGHVYMSANIAHLVRQKRDFIWHRCDRP